MYLRKNKRLKSVGEITIFAPVVKVSPNEGLRI